MRVSAAKNAVAVTDADGKSMATTVLLSVIDEALFQLQQRDYNFFANYFSCGGGSFSSQQTDELLPALYTTVASGVVQSYASHSFPVVDPGCQCGGGGDPVPRENFKDTALFEVVNTDADGRGTVTFELPDNLTSWRVTGRAISDDFHAGSSSTLLPVGLPLFVEPVLNTSYLASDRPALRLRAFGDALEPGQPVSFEVRAIQDGPDRRGQHA
jgi:hypothetical protein